MALGTPSNFSVNEKKRVSVRGERPEHLLFHLSEYELIDFNNPRLSSRTEDVVEREMQNYRNGQLNSKRFC